MLACNWAINFFFSIETILVVNQKCLAHWSRERGEDPSRNSGRITAQLRSWVNIHWQSCCYLIMSFIHFSMSLIHFPCHLFHCFIVFCICLETIKTWLMKNAKKHVTADPPTAKSLSQLIQQFIQMQASLYNFRFFKSFPSKAKINFTYF